MLQALQLASHFASRTTPMRRMAGAGNRSVIPSGPGTGHVQSEEHAQQGVPSKSLLWLLSAESESADTSGGIGASGTEQAESRRSDPRIPG